MDKNLLEKAENLANRDYKTEFSVEQLPSGKTLYMAKNPELVGCMAQGETLEDAIKNLRDARIDYIYDSLVEGVTVPEPEAPISEIRTVNTGNNAIYVPESNFRIEQNVPINVPTQPIIRKLHQYSNA